MGLFSSIGGFLNDITGASSSQNKNFQQTKYLNNLSYEQQKEFAQNSHQWEMQDLQKAGINPALTATGSSAGSIAGGGATNGSGGNASSGLDVISTMAGINATTAKAELDRAQADQIKELLGGEKAIQNANIQQLNALTSSHISSAKLMNRKASGNTDSFNVGGYGFNAGYSRTR